MTAIIMLGAVSYAYRGAPVLEDVVLTVEPGEFLGIVGANGSGKTTLLKIMLGLLAPTRGQVWLFGAPPARFRQWSRLGYVPQTVRIDPTLPITAEEVAQTGLVSAPGARQPLGRDRRRRAVDALARVGMEQHASVRVGTLSAGQQQRVLIARALVSEPELLVLDEPTAGVDPNAQASTYDLLHHLHADRGVTVVLVSHDIDVAARDVTRRARLDRTLTLDSPLRRTRHAH